MRNRFCQNFTSGVPVSFHDQMMYNSTQILTFSAEFYQPFIDVEVVNESALICGPFLGIAIEISKKLMSNLTYISTHAREYIEMMTNRQTNILLCPSVPSNLFMTNISKYTQLSRSIGDLSMNSILSAKEPVDSMFHLLNIFDIEIWITFIVFYILISSLSLVISDSNAFTDYLAIPLRQSIQKFNRKQRTALITLIWFWGTMILMWAYSGIVLTFLVFSTPYTKIDSIDDLAETDINFTVFEGEPALDYMKDPEEPHYHEFLNRYTVVCAWCQDKDEWEKNNFDKISHGIYAMISDQPFLDYYIATKLLDYPNLYRSKSNQLVLPYFMPLAKHNSKKLINTINNIICHLIESGIYETWVRDTLERNNDAIRLGVAEVEDKTCDYTQLNTEKFKSLFYFQIIAFISSVLILIVEYMYKNYSHN